MLTIAGKTKQVQRKWLEAYAAEGTMLRACQMSGASRAKVKEWERDNIFGFSDKMEEVKELFREHLEGLMFKRLEDPKCHPVLYIFVMKAHWPDKYGDKPKDTGEAEAGKELLEHFKRWGRGEKIGVKEVDLIPARKREEVILALPEVLEQPTELDQEALLEGEGQKALYRMRGGLVVQPASRWRYDDL